MSRAQHNAGPPGAVAELVGMALDRLITDHGRAIDSHDLPWLGNLLADVRHGHALRKDEEARVSRIRGALAWRYHRYGGHAGMCRDRDGAA
jgi:hypothetical protein